MRNSIVSLVTIAALFGTLGLGTHTSAKEVTVKKGDTLWGIAKANDILVEDLKEWNGLSNHIIHPEDRLKVALTEEYLIEKGDTLSHIAAQFEGVSWRALQEWNQLEDPDLIKAGDTLTIYLKGNPPSEKGNTSSKTNEKQATDEKKEIVNTKVEATNAASEEPVTQEQKVSASVDKPLETKEDEKEQSIATELTVTATAYTATCDGCSGITSTGINLLDNPEQKVISVDPNVIPLGSKVYVEGYGHAIAGDTGGAIKGNKIDIFIPDKQDAINWGVKEVNIKVYK